MKFIFRVVAKALLLYLAINLLVGLLVIPHLGRITAYHTLFPARARLPFGESPAQAYNFSLFDLDAMFASHEITAPRAPGEYRVVIIGDSSVWGTLLRPEETLAGQLNTQQINAPDGRKMRFYNLGYPTISLTKDLIILDEALKYQPDLVIWIVTLEAFPRDKQLLVPIVENNPQRAREVIQRYALDLPLESLKLPSFWDRTLIGRRKAIADDLRLQIYGFLWAATGIDQVYPAGYPRAQTDLQDDATFHGKSQLIPQDLAVDVLLAGRQGLNGTPLMVVNEPILISTGKNSQVRYNFYYPRQAYDAYRQILSNALTAESIPYLDAWNIVPGSDYTNSAIHIDQKGTALLAGAIRAGLQGVIK